MRTITFRGKVKHEGRWVYGSLLVYGDGEHNIFEQREHNYKLDSYNVEPETVGQSTGLCDKNEKEIYEGDILEDAGLRYEVCWYDEIAAFMAEDAKSKKPFLLSDLDLNETVIIGNIFDNPDLLNSK